MQIFDAFGAIVSRLGRGVTCPLQNRAHRRSGGGLEQVSQKRGLVESPFPFAGRVERNGDDHVELAAAKARVVQGFAKPTSDGIPKVALFCVLELVHKPANEAAATVGRDRAIEMQNAMLAVRATEGLGDGAGKR